MSRRGARDAAMELTGFRGPPPILANMGRARLGLDRHAGFHEICDLAGFDGAEVAASLLSQARSPAAIDRLLWRSGRGQFVASRRRRGWHDPCRGIPCPAAASGCMSSTNACAPPPARAPAPCGTILRGAGLVRHRRFPPRLPMGRSRPRQGHGALPRGPERTGADAAALLGAAAPPGGNMSAAREPARAGCHARRPSLGDCACLLVLGLLAWGLA